MKMFTDCSGPCCICGIGGGCLAGHGDDYFCKASKEQVIERLNRGTYKSYIDVMIKYLKDEFGIKYDIAEKKAYTMQEIEGYEKFLELRRWFMEKLDKVDMSDGCKSYEGTFELFLSYPCFFDEKETGEKDVPDFVMIKLHCYVIGPWRHYEWRGRTIEEAVNNARKEIESWED